MFVSPGVMRLQTLEKSLYYETEDWAYLAPGEIYLLAKGQLCLQGDPPQREEQVKGEEEVIVIV